MHFPLFFYTGAVLLVCLAVDVWYKRDQPWALSSAMVYVTTTAWYFVDLFITPENYDFLPASLLNQSYMQVTAFLVLYRIFVPPLTRRLVRFSSAPTNNPVSPETVFYCALIFWVILLACAVARMEAGLLTALFPLDARMGETMWARGAAGDAGSAGFLISSGAYLYLLVCSSFGMLFFFLRSVTARWLASLAMLISWPYFLLSGTRSIFLAVAVPSFFSFLLFDKKPMVLKLIAIAGAFLVLNAALLVVGEARGVGFREYFLSEAAGELEDEAIRHKGLNMIQELCFVNVFAAVNEPAYGSRYLQELANVIPRAIWADKPLLGIDYAVFRGFQGGSSDIGVVATISSGMIGGGILNFGPLLGPVAPAFLIALYAAILARWWSQRASLLRRMLFLAGLGLTFNLGRDITLLVLWPVVFGYFIVFITEKLMGRKHPPSFIKRRVSRSLPPLSSSSTPALLIHSSSHSEPRT